MGTDQVATLTRRRAITGALGAVAGGAALALATPAAALGANGDPVKLGEANASTATTAVLCTGTHAVYAEAATGDAFRGIANGAGGSGAFGSGASPTSYGVFGYQQTTGARAALGGPQAALWASQFGAPYALLVEGKVRMTRSGRVLLVAGHRTVDIPVPGGLGGQPLPFATLLADRGGTWITSVRPNVPSAGKIRVTVNKAPSSSVYVAWLVLG